MELNREARAGIIATIVILALGYTLSMLSSIQEQKEWGTPYHIIFNRIEGIEEGTGVYFAGRFVGRVRSLTIRPSDQRVVVTISIQPFRNAQLTYQSHYRVEGRLWGARWISIDPEDGDPVPPNGEVAGESVPRLSHMMQHGIQALDRVDEQMAAFKEEYGQPAEIRARMMTAIKQFNDIAFDIRAQVNNFNKFSGLARQRLDEISGRIADRARLARAQVQQMASQLRMYSAMLKTRVAEGETRMQGMIGGFEAKVKLLQAYVDRANAFLSEQEKLERQLSAMRARIEEYEQIAQTLRLVSSNPELARQLKGGLRGLRERARRLRESVEGFSGKSPAPTEPQAEPTPAPSPVASPSPEAAPTPTPEATPSPVPAPEAPSPSPE